MFFISKTTADLGSALALPVTYRSVAYESRARLQRVKTLDGGSAFTHFGVTDTDRDISIEGYLTAAQAAALKSLYVLGIPLRFSCREGSFLGFINDLSVSRDNAMAATVYFKEKLTA